LLLDLLALEPGIFGQVRWLTTEVPGSLPDLLALVLACKKFPDVIVLFCDLDQTEVVATHEVKRPDRDLRPHPPPTYTLLLVMDTDQCLRI
jgi:hypothetical protein